MNLNAQQREQLRLSLLRFLDVNPARFGLAVPLLLQMVRNEGWPANGDSVAAELQYLADKKLAEPVDKIISPENRAWRITATGRDHLALNE